ncbi:short-chain dehydrogenase reductase family [Apiospora aurea]|uniref:Short-chain dehydrogenase reductase family n=1 Tax=Apiospora aurea TaxID=335848 RepID=A0ABR1PS84_9PEZI
MGFLYSQFFKIPSYPTGSYQGKTIVITGSNTGLGKEAARHYIRMGSSRMILAVRNLDQGHEAKHDIEATTGCAADVIQVWRVDMSSYASVQKFAARVNTELDRVDIFLANAGCAKLKYTTAEDNETQITVNVVATFLLAMLVMPKLRQTALRHQTRPVLSITSSGAYQHTTFPQRTAPEGKLFATINDKETAEKHWAEQYPLSKLLEIFLVRAFAERYPAAAFPVTLSCVSPGLCHSGLAREQDTLGFRALKFVLARSTEVGSRTLVHAGGAGEAHGQFLEDCEVDPLTELVTGNKGVQDRLWMELVEKLRAIKSDVMEF